MAELGNRKRAKEKEIAVLKTQCQSEVSRIRIPEIYGSEILKQLKKQLEEGEMTRLTDFLKELEILCDWLGKHTREAEKEYQEAAKKEMKKRGIYKSRRTSEVVCTARRCGTETATICI